MFPNLRPLLYCIFLLTQYLPAQVTLHFREDSFSVYYYRAGDEFTNPLHTERFWKYYGSMRSIYTNKEQQYYTEGKNHTLSDGLLYLTARRDTLEAKTVDAWHDTVMLRVNEKTSIENKRKYFWTSGQLISKEVYGPGFFECRFKISESRGFWPAFWLYSGSPDEEIDILECKSERPHSIHVDTHCPLKCDLVNLLLQRRSFGGWVKTGVNLRRFNTVSCIWSEEEIRFYLNGTFVAVSPVGFRNPKLVILNLAVPSSSGPFKPGPGAREDSCAFVVDYVRIWSGQKSLQQNKPLLVDSGSRNSIDTKIKTKRLRTYGEKRRRCGSDGFVTISYRNDSLLFRVNGKFHSKKLVQFSLLNEGDDLVQGGFLPKNGLLALALKGARVSAVAITVDGQKTKIPVSDIYNP